MNDFLHAARDGAERRQPRQLTRHERCLAILDAAPELQRLGRDIADALTSVRVYGSRFRLVPPGGSLMNPSPIFRRRSKRERPLTEADPRRFWSADLPAMGDGYETWRLWLSDDRDAARGTWFDAHWNLGGQPRLDFFKPVELARQLTHRSSKRQEAAEKVITGIFPYLDVTPGTGELVVRGKHNVRDWLMSQVAAAAARTPD